MAAAAKPAWKQTRAAREAPRRSGPAAGPAPAPSMTSISERLISISPWHVSMRGTCTIGKLVQLMKMPLELREGVFGRLNDQQYFEVGRITGDDYVFCLSPSGKEAGSRARAIVTVRG